jgi:hypothetical protein
MHNNNEKLAAAEAALRPFAAAAARIHMFGSPSDDATLQAVENDSSFELFHQSSDLGFPEDQLLAVGHLSAALEAWMELTGESVASLRHI